MNRRRSQVLAATAVIVVALCACNAILGTESSITYVDGDGGATDGNVTSDGPANEASTDAPAPDGGDAGADADANADMVLVVAPAASFLIDRHEVTHAQFTAFKEKLALPGGDAGFPAGCTWKAGVSVACNAGDNGTHAVGCVDWCDAFAYCASAGKRLCGRIAGGAPLQQLETNDALKSEWPRACANNSVADRFPYGMSPDAGACNTKESEAGASLPPGSFPACVGGVPGLVDMAGNVAEYSNSCFGDGGPPAQSDTCSLHGGSFELLVQFSRCDELGTIARDYAGAPHIGFRCCKDP